MVGQNDVYGRLEMGLAAPTSVSYCYYWGANNRQQRELCFLVVVCVVDESSPASSMVKVVKQQPLKFDQK